MRAPDEGDVRVAMGAADSHQPCSLAFCGSFLARAHTRVEGLRHKPLPVTRQTLYRFVSPKGELRADGTKLLKRKGQNVSS